MKTFHQNLLIILALSLCGLCAYQWYGQAQQRIQFNKLNEIANLKSASIQEYTNSIKNLEHQVGQMDASITELRGTVETNAQVMLSQKQELSRLKAQGESLTNQIVLYKQTVESLQARLKEAYDGVTKQNEGIKQLTAERDEYVKKYNDIVTNRNDIVNRYNELVKQVEKLQAGGGKPPEK